MFSVDMMMMMIDSDLLSSLFFSLIFAAWKPYTNASLLSISLSVALVS